MAERELTYGEAVKEAIAEEMRRDPSVFIIGEDIAEAGHPFKTLVGLVQEFGTFSRSVADGGMNLNVWLRTFTSAMVCSIFGMRQPMHSLPVDPARWCVCCSIVAVCGPLGERGP